MKFNRSFILASFIPILSFSQNRYEVVIDEIMSDPTPSVGLTANEWVELRNTGNAPINLQHWRMGDASGQSGPFPNILLQPDSFVIVCSAGAAVALSAFGTTISVSNFPSLDNERDQVFLRSIDGSIIHAVDYSSSWHQNNLKQDGGWTLEMIDPKNPCTGMENWRSSIDPGGGTPGKKNSVDGQNADQTAPQLKRAYTSGNSTIILVFDEPVDSLHAATIGNYTIDGGLAFTSAITLPPLFDEVQLTTNTSLAANTIYTITAASIRDCRNNTVGAFSKVKAGLPTDPSPGELIINEILFNPSPSGFDYVELYNRSNKIFDASRLYIANRNSSGGLSSIKALTPDAYYVFPGDYIVITEDNANLALHYLVSYPDRLLVLHSPPSFPDNEGIVVALNFQGAIVDEVKYNASWHFKLINNPEGVALERIDPAGPSQVPDNWHSAATSAGYGTPGYRNSQFMQAGINNATIQVQPKIFSPDNDGFDDIASVQYQVPEPGFAGSISIFDAAGRIVRHLVRNALLGRSGNFNWDGLNDKGLKLPAGIYILYAEIVRLDGKKEELKIVIVLASKLR